MKIGCFSSSTPITAISPQRFERAQRFLNTQHVTLVTGALTRQRDGYRSGTINARAAELNALIHDDSIDVLMATIGGSNTNAILPAIDWDYLNQHPKVVVGYSDVTALLLAVQVKAPRCRVIYGPALVASLGEWAPLVAFTWQSFLSVALANGQSAITVQAPAKWTDEACNWETFERNKRMQTNTWGFTTQPTLSGRLMGGNLNTMAGVIASPYFPQLQPGDILLIEDAEKDAATVEKNFMMLKLAGVLDSVSGVLLGKHALFDDAGTKRRPVDILLEVMGNQPLPIIYDYDSCHTVPMISTPLGSYATIDARRQTITFEQF